MSTIKKIYLFLFRIFFVKHETITFFKSGVAAKEQHKRFSNNVVNQLKLGQKIDAI